MRPFLRFVLWFALLPLPTTGHAALTHDNAAQQAIEEQALAWLEQTRQAPDATLAPFASDGCSGGLSAGWQLLAEGSARFRTRYGDQPPWEACCVAHDRTYWQGTTEDGYTLRQAADAQLRQCVIDTGNAQAVEIAPALEKTPDDVKALFAQAAELMYVAVRIGGGPCSGLPWRWGFGWPQCGSHPASELPDEKPAPP